MTLGDFTGIASLILVLVAIWKGWFEGRNLQRTGENLSADLMSKYQEMVDNSLDRGLHLSKRITELETADRQKAEEIRTLKERDIQKDKRIRDLEVDLSDMRDWAHRLVAQVESLGLTPEEFLSHRDDPSYVAPRKLPSSRSRRKK